MKIAFIDSLVYYNIKPINWHNLDSLTKEKYHKTYSFNINTNNIDEVDTSLFFSAYRETKETNKISFIEIKKILSEVTLPEWGLMIQDIYLQSDKDYMEYIIYKEGNDISNQAIMEQVIPNLSKKKIKYMLKKMGKYKITLEKKEKSSYKDGLRKKHYEDYYKNTCEKLKDLL